MLNIPFCKYHGLENDYLFINAMKTLLDSLDLPRLTRSMSARNTGIGADGIILVCKSDRADFRMRIFNSDGSEAEMCGNGLRCFARYCLDYGLTTATRFAVETLAGIRNVSFDDDLVSANMGGIDYDGATVPLNQAAPLIRQSVSVGTTRYEMTAASVGNPHVAIPLDSKEELDALDLATLGHTIQTLPLFPNGVNVSFFAIAERTPANDNSAGSNILAMRTFERGAGETRACGTAATAIACIAHHHYGLNVACTVHLPGGPISVNCRDRNAIIMRGTATRVFEGMWISDDERD